jgi:hypothetical protein
MPIPNQVGLQQPKPPSDVAWFDYTDVSSSVAKFLKGQADRIRRSVGKSIIEIGKDLVAAKHYLSHGAFLRWVESEVGIPARTAQAYMQVAQWATGKNATVALLPPTLLYLLSAPSTPKDFIDDVLKRAGAGEHIGLPAIRGELKALRETLRDEEKQDGGVVHRPPERRAENPPTKLDVGATVVEAVAVLARGLSEADFVRVRDIMTSKIVLDDPKLPEKIEAAFRTVTRSPERTRKLRPQASGVPHWPSLNGGEIQHAPAVARAST